MGLSISYPATKIQRREYRATQGGLLYHKAASDWKTFRRDVHATTSTGRCTWSQKERTPEHPILETAPPKTPQEL